MSFICITPCEMSNGCKYNNVMPQRLCVASHQNEPWELQVWVEDDAGRRPDYHSEVSILLTFADGTTHAQRQFLEQGACTVLLDSHQGGMVQAVVEMPDSSEHVLGCSATNTGHMDSGAWYTMRCISHKDQQLQLLEDSSWYGGHVWSAGLVLAKFILDGGVAKGKRCVELGAGTGVVGLAAGLCGAKDVLVTDRCEMLWLLEANIKKNLLSNVTAAEWNWGDTKEEDKSFDLVLAADVVYDPELYVRLVRTLEVCCASSGCTVLLSYHQRNAQSAKHFFHMVEAHFTTRVIHDGGDVQIFELKRRMQVVQPVECEFCTFLVHYEDNRLSRQINQDIVEAHLEWKCAGCTEPRGLA